jgi:hypothetical protein
MKTLQFQELLEKCPKAAESLLRFMSTGLVAIKDAAQQASPDEPVMEIDRDLEVSYTSALIGANPRILYEFFDQYGILMTLICIGSKDWAAKILNTKNQSDTILPGTVENRIDAEIAGFEECFNILQKQLQ